MWGVGRDTLEGQELAQKRGQRIPREQSWLCLVLPCPLLAPRAVGCLAVSSAEPIQGLPTAGPRAVCPRDRHRGRVHPAW